MSKLFAVLMGFDSGPLAMRSTLGVFVDAGFLQGVDAPLSTVQIPDGCKVVGRAGTKSTAYLAAAQCRRSPLPGWRPA